MQKKVKEFVDKHQLESNETIRCMDLVSEVGELTKEIIKGSDYGSKEFSITDETILEIGDCMFSMLALCNLLDIDATHALDLSLEKYNQRFQKNKTISSK